MTTKMAGTLSLQEMVRSQIELAREKIAAAEEKSDEKKDEGRKVLPFKKKDEKGEKEDEKKEKTSSTIDLDDPNEVEKLASALDFTADLLKEAEGGFIGGESPQGGQLMPNNGVTGGKQSYKKDAPAGHSVPMSTGLKARADAGKAATLVPDNGDGTLPNYPKKGVFKTASTTVAELIAARREKTAASLAHNLGRASSAVTNFATKNPHAAAGIAGAGLGAAAGAAGSEDGHRIGGALKGGVVGGALGAGASKGREALNETFGKNKNFMKGVQKQTSLRDAAAAKAKVSSVDAYNFILNKLAESAQGGETLDSAAGESGGAPVPSNPGRQLISSNAAPAKATKREAKAPRKPELATVLSEPAFSAGKDNKVNENLRNASKGGVKIAAARALLQKIAAEGCTCNEKGECSYCKLKAATAKKSDA